MENKGTGTFLISSGEQEQFDEKSGRLSGKIGTGPYNRGEGSADGSVYNGVYDHWCWLGDLKDNWV